MTVFVWTLRDVIAVIVLGLITLLLLGAWSLEKIFEWHRKWRRKK